MIDSFDFFPFVYPKNVKESQSIRIRNFRHIFHILRCALAFLYSTVGKEGEKDSATTVHHTCNYWTYWMALQIGRNNFCQFLLFFFIEKSHANQHLQEFIYTSYGIESAVSFTYIHILLLFGKWSPYNVFGVLVSLLLFLPFDMITTGCIFNEWYFLPVENT